ncbi:spore germination lipase LipC [soil metagenome]
MVCLVVTMTLMLGAASGTAPGTTTETPPDTSAPEPLDYLALGDSLTTGYSVDKGYVKRYRIRLRKGVDAPVRLTNLGRNGWTSTQLLRALRKKPRFRRAVRDAEVVTWRIGTNDLRKARLKYKRGTCGGADNQECLRRTARRFRTNWNKVTRRILFLRADHDTIIRTATLYNPYVAQDKRQDTWKDDEQLTDFEVLRPYFHAVNRHIIRTTSKKEIPAARVYRVFNGRSRSEDPRAKGYIFTDNIHMNLRGHKIFARLLHKLGYAPLIPE